MDKMQMICDPYQKTIEFRWFDEASGDYISMNGLCAELTSNRFTKDVTIQTRADEIVHIIDEVIDPGNNGIEIHFIGTQDDYEDLRRVVEDYYAVKNIHCVKDGYYYHDAEYSLKEITTCFEKVSGIIEKYDEGKEVTEILNNYEETIKSELAICVMGLYSSGKSAFINSLVGMEILPSASDPTTAKVCRIRNSDFYRISFTVDNQTCFIEFEDEMIEDKIQIINAPKDVHEIISKASTYKEVREEDEEGNPVTKVIRIDKRIESMYAVLKLLNSKCPFPGHKDGELIEIDIHYVNSLLPSNRFDFVIYDTPGSNSATNREHFTVLNKALSNQTNALPVILTTPDTMDSTENDPLLDLIHDNQNKLDTTNAMIVVNKSDEKMDKALREKKVKIDGLKLTKWKSTRIFFVSALLGLASKKSDPHDEDSWSDDDMYQLFEEKAHRYERKTGDKQPRKLFDFNIVDKSRVLTPESLPDDDAPIVQRLLYNSGLASVELEIANYAVRYAQYIKARESIKYLDQAMEICERKLKKVIEKRDFNYSMMVASHNLKIKQFSEQLFMYTKEIQSEAELKFKQRIQQILTEFKVSRYIYTNIDPLRRSYVYKDFKTIWENLFVQVKYNKITLYDAFLQMQKHVSDSFNQLMEDLVSQFNAAVSEFWSRYVDSFKDELSRIVLDSDHLNEEQKQVLNNVIFDMKYVPHDRFDLKLGINKGIKKRMLAFVPIGKEKYDNNSCCENFLSLFGEASEAKKEDVIVYYTNLFYEWSESLSQLLVGEICTFNQKLSEEESSIAELQREIIALNEDKRTLVDSSDYIRSLIDIQIAE